jgi:hypothetical protein
MNSEFHPCQAGVLPHEPHVHPSFFQGYFGDRVLFCAQADLDCDPPILSLLRYLGYTPVHVTCPAFVVAVVESSFMNCFCWPGTEILPISASQVVRFINFFFFKTKKSGCIPSYEIPSTVSR